MTPVEVHLKIDRFISDYLEKKNHFLDAGVKVSPEDEAAFILASVTPHGASGPGTNILFNCASTLDPNSPPVTQWVEECVRALRTGAPELVEAAGQLYPSCLQEPEPGLLP